MTTIQAIPTRSPTRRRRRPRSSGHASHYHMNVWAELLNPLPTTAELAPNPSNNANLVNAINGNGNPVYQLVITSPNRTCATPPTWSAIPTAPPRASAQPFATQPYTPQTGTFSSTATGGQVLAVVNNWGTVQNVTPVGTAQSSTPGPAPAATRASWSSGPPNPPLLRGRSPRRRTRRRSCSRNLRHGEQHGVHRRRTTDGSANHARAADDPVAAAGQPEPARSTPPPARAITPTSPSITSI